MSWKTQRFTALAVSLAMLMTCAALSPGIALAHTGHSHDGGGTTFDSVLQVGATASALVIAYILTTWFFRYRDRE